MSGAAHATEFWFPAINQSDTDTEHCGNRDAQTHQDRAREYFTHQSMVLHLCQACVALYMQAADVTILSKL